jgi:hypothetical protein
MRDRAPGGGSNAKRSPVNNSSPFPLAPLVLEGMEISVTDELVRFAGVISMRDPADTVTPYLRKIHAATIEAGLKKLSVDLTKLRFMNSSSIRSIVSWVEWIRNEPEGNRYVLSFITKPELTWQTTTFAAIQTLGGSHVVVR